MEKKPERSTILVIIDRDQVEWLDQMAHVLRTSRSATLRQLLDRAMHGERAKTFDEVSERLDDDSGIVMEGGTR